MFNRRAGSLQRAWIDFMGDMVTIDMSGAGAPSCPLEIQSTAPNRILLRRGVQSTAVDSFGPLGLCILNPRAARYAVSPLRGAPSARRTNYLNYACELTRKGTRPKGVGNERSSSPWLAAALVNGSEQGEAVLRTPSSWEEPFGWRIQAQEGRRGTRTRSAVGPSRLRKLKTKPIPFRARKSPTPFFSEGLYDQAY
jgi:hypothetical protein